MKKILYIILLASLFSSCAAYKRHILDRFCLPSSVVKDTIIVAKTDSTFIKMYDSIVNRPATKQTIIVNSPCDSNGILKKFEQQSISGKDTVTIYSDGKKIYVKTNCDECESRYKLLEQKYYSKNDTSKIHVEYVTKIKLPIYTWWEEFMLSSVGTFTIIALFAGFIIWLLLFIKKLSL